MKLHDDEWYELQQKQRKSRLIHSSTSFFRKMEKKSKPVTTVYVPKPVFDFASRSYEEILDSYAVALRTMEANQKKNLS